MLKVTLKEEVLDISKNLLSCTVSCYTIYYFNFINTNFSQTLTEKIREESYSHSDEQKYSIAFYYIIENEISTLELLELDNVTLGRIRDIIYIAKRYINELKEKYK